MTSQLTQPDPAAAINAALTKLWDMSQQPDGTPKSFRANELLIAIHEGIKTLTAQLAAETRRADGMTEVAKEMKFQRDETLRRLHGAVQHGEHMAIEAMIRDISLEYDVPPTVATVIIDLLTGVDTEITSFAEHDFRKVIEEIAEDMEDYAAETADDDMEADDD